MKAGPPSLIRYERRELQKMETTAPAILEALAERRPYSDVVTQKVTVLGPRGSEGDAQTTQ